jgi:hypothetical protein
MDNGDRRELRRRQTAEVFTPPNLVTQMLNRLPKEVWKKGKTFCDPAAGNGNLLIAVLIRKIQRGHKTLDALRTLYGVDIMQDNIRECRLRLLKVCAVVAVETITEDHIKAVLQNIIWINPKRYPNGSLDYIFDFPNKLNLNDVSRWLNLVNEQNKLDDVELPVMDTTFTPVGGTPDMFED